jgi:hypothetical protein
MISSTFCGLGDRKLPRLLALENLGGVDAELAVNICKASPVAKQAARHSEFAMRRDRRQRVSEDQCRQLFAAAVEKRIGGDDERGDALLHERSKCLVDLVIAAGIEHKDLQRELTCRSLDIGAVDTSKLRIGGVDKQSNGACLGNQLMQ